MIQRNKWKLKGLISTMRGFSGIKASKKANQSFYDVLNVPESASGEQIKKAYFELVKTSHPDKNPNDSGMKVPRE